MRIRIDDALYSFLFGQWPPTPVEIEAFRGGVQFDPCAGARGGVENCRDIDLVRLPFQEQTTGRMRQDGHETIFHRPNDPLRHFCFREIENGMD